MEASDRQSVQVTPNPFFLFLAHPQPHVPLFASSKFNGRSKNGLYTDVIEEIDYSVGLIMQTLKDNNLEIGFFDKGKPVIPENIQHRKLDDIKPGGLGTFFIKQIMDDAVFKKDEQQWVNHLVLTKKI